MVRPRADVGTLMTGGYIRSRDCGPPETFFAANEWIEMALYPMLPMPEGIAHGPAQFLAFCNFVYLLEYRENENH